MAVDLELAPGSVVRLTIQSEFVQEQVAFADVHSQSDDEFPEISDFLAHVGPGADLAVYPRYRRVSETTVLGLLFTGDAREGFLFHGMISIAEMTSECTFLGTERALSEQDAEA